MADTLHYAHQQGVAHRDLKPGNIVVAHVDGRPVPHLVDFDTAVVRDATLISVVGEAIGSVGFADPVHGFGRTRQGSLQAALDIYSLGALLYWVFTGKTPPAAGPGAAQRIVETALLGLRGVPAHVRRGLCLLVGHATQPALESRYQTAAALATDLRELAEGALLPGRDSDRLVRDVFTEMDGLLHRRDAGLDIGVRKQGSEVGRWVATKAGGDLYVIYDADYRFFMVGLMFESDQRYREFLASAPYRKLHRLFGTRLRTEAPTQAETGGVYLQHPILEVARRGAAPSGWTMVEEFQQFRRIAGGGPRRAS